MPLSFGLALISLELSERKKHIELKIQEEKKWTAGLHQEEVISKVFVKPGEAEHEWKGMLCFYFFSSHFTFCLKTAFKRQGQR